MNEKLELEKLLKEWQDPLSGCYICPDTLPEIISAEVKAAVEGYDRDIQGRLACKNADEFLERFFDEKPSRSVPICRDRG